MKRIVYTLLLVVCASVSAWAQQSVKVNSIKELRNQPAGTSVSLTMNGDTVFATVDDGLCLCDEMRIRVEGINLTPATVLTGTLVGTIGKWQDYPLFQISAEGSQYQVLVSMPFARPVDMEAYEKSLSSNNNVYVDPWDEVPDDPRTGIKTVQSIKEFKTLEAETEARLVLCYDTVLFALNGDIYVRDGNLGGAINFKDTGLDLQEGMVLIGSVVGRLVMVDGTSMFVATENTTDQYYKVVGTLQYTMPFYDFESQEQDDYIDDIVLTGEVIVDSLSDTSGVRRLYAYKQNGGARLLVTDKYGFNSQPISVPAKCPQLKGILARGGNDSELFLLNDISVTAQPQGIALPRQDAPYGDNSRYNLAGQRVTPSYKGITLTRQGRKVVK